MDNSNLRVASSARHINSPPKHIVERSDGALTLHIPIKVKRRSGRRKIESAEGKRLDTPRLDIDTLADVHRQSHAKSGVEALGVGAEYSEEKTWSADTSPTVLQLALARAYEWTQMLEAGEVESITELADTLKVDPRYVSRMLNLTTLAPDLVELILDDGAPDNLSVFDSSAKLPALWDDQRKIWHQNPRQ